MNDLAEVSYFVKKPDPVDLQRRIEFHLHRLLVRAGEAQTADDFIELARDLLGRAEFEKALAVTLGCVTPTQRKVDVRYHKIHTEPVVRKAC